MAAPGTSVEMTAESLCAAVADGTQDLDVWPRQMSLVSIDESVARDSDDIGHLKGWPTHFLTRFRERFTSSGLESSTASIGLLTDCR
jgi:hypothetical protein